jgi:hypothetical protein
MAASWSLERSASGDTRRFQETPGFHVERLWVAPIQEETRCLKPFQFPSRRKESPHWRRCRRGTIPATVSPSNTGPTRRRSPRSSRQASRWTQFTGSNDELTDPARYQYREAFVLVEAVFDGVPVNYCPYIFVDNDAAISRGWAQGFPKKLASVYQTRSFSAPSLAAAPLAKGSRFGASVAAHGERLATARIQLEEPVADPATVFNRPTTMRRYFPQLAAGQWDKPPVDELTMSLTDNLAIVDVWTGSAELKMPEVDGEDMYLIAPLRVGRGYRLGMSYSVTDLRILKSYAG